MEYLFRKFSPVCLRILITRAYRNNPSNTERKLPSERPKTLTRTRKREKKKDNCKAFCVTHNGKMYLRMPSENFEEIFQLIKHDITKENTKIRESVPPMLKLAAKIRFLSTGKSCKSLKFL